MHVIDSPMMMTRKPMFICEGVDMITGENSDERMKVRGDQDEPRNATKTSNTLIEIDCNCYTENHMQRYVSI